MGWRIVPFPGSMAICLAYTYCMYNHLKQLPRESRHSSIEYSLYGSLLFYIVHRGKFYNLHYKKKG